MNVFVSLTFLTFGEEVFFFLSLCFESLYFRLLGLWWIILCHSCLLLGKLYRFIHKAILLGRAKIYDGCFLLRRHLFAQKSKRFKIRHRSWSWNVLLWRFVIIASSRLLVIELRRRLFLKIAAVALRYGVLLGKTIALKGVV